MNVRERPPVRLTVEAITPSGRRYRWANDSPTDRPTGLNWSSTMPGGYESCSLTLPRRTNDGHADLERLATIRVLGPGEVVAGEFRIERIPSVSGDQMAVSPSAVGWQAALTDNKDARFLGVDRVLGRWQGPSRQRQANLIGSSWNPSGPSTMADATTGQPALETAINENSGWSSADRPIVEAWYDASSPTIGRLRASWARVGTTINTGDTSWGWEAAGYADDVASAGESTTNLRAAGPGTVDFALSSRRFARVRLYYAAAGGTAQRNLKFAVDWTDVRVIGNHGLTIQGSTPQTEGLLASDIVAYVLRKFAPALNFTTGADGTIAPSSYIIPQFAYLDATDAGELVRQAVRFELLDWAVWENRTFHCHRRGERGRRWRARAGQVNLEEAGPQIDRLWESVVVQFRDVDGSTRTVGPPGSGAHTEDASLKDTDPENPANKVGITRRALLQAGTLTAGAAIQLGARFLSEQKRLDSAGRARIVGHVMDDHGVLYPYWAVRAGDQLAVIDAADTSYRRIVRAGCDEASLTCSVDLDSPPDALDALLERLGVAMVATGF